MNDTTLGAVLHARRGHRSLREISRECGISIATLSRLEAGIIELPSRETLTAIAQGYGLPLGQLAQLVYCGREATPA